MAYTLRQIPMADSAMTGDGVKIIIEGVTEDGRPFRPSDWIERISGSLSTFGKDRRIRYSHYVQPQIVDGRKCLAVDPRLNDVNPGAYKFLMDFAKGNRLRVRDPGRATAAVADKPARHGSPSAEASA